MKNITIFLKELERCDVCDPTMNGGIDCFSYNGFTVGQSSASYEPYLRRLYQNAVEELLCLPADKSAILNAELLRIAGCQRYFDVPSYECLLQHERDLAIRNRESLKQETEFIRHILNCVELQKSMLKDFDSLISNPEETNKMQAPESKEKKAMAAPVKVAEPAPVIQPEASDWMDLKEVCDYFKLPKNSIKDRQWRIKHGFPCITRPFEKLRFHRIEVEKWMEKKGKC